MRIHLALLAALAISCAGSSSGDDRTGGKADDPDTQSAASLVDLLSRDGTIAMPPAGEDNGANEMSVVVDVVPIAEEDELMPIVVPRLDAAANELMFDEDGNPSTLGFAGLFNEPDIHTELATGFQRRSVIDALLATVASDQRDDVEAILTDPDFFATYVHFLSYDLGAEVVGREIFVIHPLSGSEAIVVAIDFVQT